MCVCVCVCVCVRVGQPCSLLRDGEDVVVCIECERSAWEQGRTRCVHVFPPLSACVSPGVNQQVGGCSDAPRARSNKFKTLLVARRGMGIHISFMCDAPRLFSGGCVRMTSSSTRPPAPSSRTRRSFKCKQNRGRRHPLAHLVSVPRPSLPGCRHVSRAIDWASTRA